MSQKSFFNLCSIEELAQIIFVVSESDWYWTVWFVYRPLCPIFFLCKSEHWTQFNERTTRTWNLMLDCVLQRISSKANRLTGRRNGPNISPHRHLRLDYRRTAVLLAWAALPVFVRYASIWKLQHRTKILQGTNCWTDLCILNLIRISSKTYSFNTKKELLSSISDILGLVTVFEVPNILDDPEVTENIYCKSRNLPNMDTQNYSADLR